VQKDYFTRQPKYAWWGGTTMKFPSHNLSGRMEVYARAGVYRWMPRTLTDEDCELIAQKFLVALSRLLANAAPTGKPEPASPSTAAALLPAAAQGSRKLAYSNKEVAGILGISNTTLWRLRALGLIQPIPGLRRIVFSHNEVERFLNTSTERRHRTT